MATPAKLDATQEARPIPAGQAYYSIADLAARWRCSRGTVYNIIRGERVLDFAAPGRKGKKLVPLNVVDRIEQGRTRVWR
jgi:hypothetical protein